MNPVTLVDEWIMGRIFDPLSWHIEERFGYNSYDVARLVIPIWPISVLVATLMNAYAYSSSAVALAIFLAAITYKQSFRIERLHKRGFQNILRIHPVSPYLRIFVLVGILSQLCTQLVESMEWFNYACFVPFWVHYCFLSCNGMPPEFRERHREFAHNLV